MRESHQRFAGFVPEEELRAILADVDRHADGFRRTHGAAGLGPRYSVIGGDVIAESLPRLVALRERILPLAVAFAEKSVHPFGDPVRSMRVQRYEEKEDGFRWHFDGHELAAIVSLENHSEGATEIVGRRWSAWLKPFFYLAYPFPRLFSFAPHATIECGDGDLVLIRGREHLHRGRSRRRGRRTIVVFTFDDTWRKPGRLRNWFARWVNY